MSAYFPINERQIRGDQRTLRRLRHCSKWKAPLYRLSRRQYRLRRQLWRFFDDLATGKDDA